MNILMYFIYIINLKINNNRHSTLNIDLHVKIKRQL